MWWDEDVTVFRRKNQSEQLHDGGFPCPLTPDYSDQGALLQLAGELRASAGNTVVEAHLVDADR